MASLINMILRGIHKGSNRNWATPRELISPLARDEARKRVVLVCEETVQAEQRRQVHVEATSDKRLKRAMNREALKELGDGPLMVETVNTSLLQVTCRYRLVDKPLWVAMISFVDDNGATKLTVTMDRFFTNAEGVIQGKREFADSLQSFAEAVEAAA